MMKLTILRAVHLTKISNIITKILGIYNRDAIIAEESKAMSSTYYLLTILLALGWQIGRTLEAVAKVPQMLIPGQ